MKEIKKTKSGEYMCSACKSAPRVGMYARKWKWKTEKGFLGHRCFNDEKEYAEKRRKELEEQKQKDLALWSTKAIYTIGSEVFYCGYYVTKPTHEPRFNRMVKVRYEEERNYFYHKGIITGLEPNGYKIKGRYVSETDIGTEENTKEMSVRRQKEYNGHVAFSSFCR